MNPMITRLRLAMLFSPICQDIIVGWYLPCSFVGFSFFAFFFILCPLILYYMIQPPLLLKKKNWSWFSLLILWEMGSTPPTSLKEMSVFGECCWPVFQVLVVKIKVNYQTQFPTAIHFMNKNHNWTGLPQMLGLIYYVLYIVGYISSGLCAERITEFYMWSIPRSIPLRWWMQNT